MSQARQQQGEQAQQALQVQQLKAQQARQALQAQKAMEPKQAQQAVQVEKVLQNLQGFPKENPKSFDNFQTQHNNLSLNRQSLHDNVFDQEKLSRMFRYPANYQEAELHTIATKFGYSNNKLKNDQKEVPVCPCCQNLVATIDIPLSYSTIPGKPEVGREIFLLPTGASMYFTFIKMVLFYLLIKLLVFDILNYIVSSSGKFCRQNATTADACKSTNFLNTSGYNLKSLENQDILNILDIISFCFTLCSIAYFTVVRKQMYNLLSWLDYSQVSQMDFSILIEKVPLFICDETTNKDQAVFQFQANLKDILEDKIIEWLRILDKQTKEEDITDPLAKDFWKFIYTKKRQQIFFNDQPQEQIVTSITLCYDLTQMENLIKYRDQLVENYLKQDEADIVNERNNAKMRKSRVESQINEEELPLQKRLDYIPNQIELLNRQYMNLCKQFAQNSTNAFNLSHFTGKAFISFQYQHYKDYFLKQYQNDHRFVTINQHHIRIRPTNKPQDIYWFNMKVSDSQRAKNIFYSYAVLLMLLILSFAALMGLQLWQKDHDINSQNVKNIGEVIRNNLISISMAVITNIINTILSTSIELLSNLEQHQTKTQRLNSVIIKTILSQALNTSFIYYFLYLIFKNNPLGTHGLVNQVLNLVTVSGLISVGLQILPPSLIFRQLMNKFKYSPEKPINLFQIQLNQALQRPEFNYAVMYSFYIVFTFVVSFYGFIVPSATLIMIAIFFIQYWVDKYNLFRRYSSPVDFGSELIKWIFKIFQFNILFHATGYFFWSFTVHFDSKSEYRAICISNITIAFIYVALTLFIPSKIRRKILGEEPTDYDHHSYAYYIEKRKFKKTFFRQSPATFCLKQTSLDKKSYIPEANDPIFVKEQEFQRFIDLKEDELQIEVYDKAEVDFFQNLENDNYDEVAAEQSLAQNLVNNFLIPSENNEK